MDEHKPVVAEMAKLAQRYQGFKVQREIYARLRKTLSDLLVAPDSRIPEPEKVKAQTLMKEIEGFNHKKTPEILHTKTAELSDGMVAFHKGKYYVGMIDGTTKIKGLFEDPDDKEEFRVWIHEGNIEIASGKNLLVIGSGYKNHCYRCKSFVGYGGQRCPRCGWYLCKECSACGCGYNQATE